MPESTLLRIGVIPLFFNLRYRHFVKDPLRHEAVSRNYNQHFLSVVNAFFNGGLDVVAAVQVGVVNPCLYADTDNLFRDLPGYPTLLR